MKVLEDHWVQLLAHVPKHHIHTCFKDPQEWLRMMIQPYLWTAYSNAWQPSQWTSFINLCQTDAWQSCWSTVSRWFWANPEREMWVFQAWTGWGRTWGLQPFLLCQHSCLQHMLIVTWSSYIFQGLTSSLTCQKITIKLENRSPVSSGAFAVQKQVKRCHKPGDYKTITAPATIHSLCS